MNIFIVPSCIKSNRSSVSIEQRFNQTIETFKSIREKDPEAYIFFSDSSPSPLSEEQIATINSNVDFFMNLHSDGYAQELNNINNVHIAKNLGETYILYVSLQQLKTMFDFSKLHGRIFKMGGRCIFENEFDIKRYAEHEGKYTFKKRKESWRGVGQYLIDTRMYSWCFSLIDEYIDILKTKNPPYLVQNIDTEHAHFLTIPQDKLVEFDKIHVGCVVALTGEYISD